MTEIGKSIKAALAEQGLTQAELAKELDVTSGTVNNWVRGRNSPDPQRIADLERVLGPLHTRGVARWLREERKKVGLTMQELADKAGLSIMTINNIENRNSDPQKGTISKLEKILHSTAPDIIDDDQAKDSMGKFVRDKTPAIKKMEIMGDMEDFHPHDEEERKRLLRNVRGIYVLMDRNENAVYVGMSNSDILTRINDHSTRNWYSKETIKFAKYIKVNDIDICKRIEYVLIQLLRPQINKQHNS